MKTELVHDVIPFMGFGFVYFSYIPNHYRHGRWKFQFAYTTRSYYELGFCLKKMSYGQAVKYSGD